MVVTRLVLVAVLLAGCVTPSGASVDNCDASWRGVASVIEEAVADSERQAVPLLCMRQIRDRRVRIGFSMPPGPDCYRLAEVELVESAKAASITLWVARHDDPLGGACSEEAAPITTELDLQAPIGDRALLDGSRPMPESSGSGPPATMSP